MDYLNTNGGGTYCRHTNIFSGALVVGAWFHNVNDTIVIRSVKERALWYVDNSNVVDYIEANKIGFWFNYIDNPQIDDIEFFQCLKAIYGSNSTVNAGGFNLTHAIVLGQIGKMSFNLCVQAIDLETNITAFSATFEQVIAQSDTVTGRAAGYFFNLASDNADVVFLDFHVPQVGHSVLSIGGGTTGRVTILHPRIDYYSSNAANSWAFLVAQGRN